jgi:hypothetical protein
MSPYFHRAEQQIQRSFKGKRKRIIYEKAFTAKRTMSDNGTEKSTRELLERTLAQKNGVGLGKAFYDFKQQKMNFHTERFHFFPLFTTHSLGCRSFHFQKGGISYDTHTMLFIFIISS